MRKVNITYQGTEYVVEVHADDLAVIRRAADDSYVTRIAPFPSEKASDDVVRRAAENYLGLINLC